MKKTSKNIEVVLAILQDEVNGNVGLAIKKMTKDYTMTWVYNDRNNKKMFPTTHHDIKQELEEVYPIKGRQYDIKNVAGGKNVLTVELIESYPDPQTKKVYRTPLVLVLEVKDHKIRTGRHYLDPGLSGKFLTKSQVAKAYKKSSGSIKIIK